VELWNDVVIGRHIRPCSSLWTAVHNQLLTRQLFANS